ncbi:MAG: uroporphyrinogen decarboxylase family protein [Armatimonadota bacterium]|nr:uroporphyrinogen decarboxylase family protein [Armatimonadota bacterium]
MNSVDRVMTALRRQQPDRVPIVEFIIDERIARAIDPDARDVPDFMDRIGLDGVCCGASFSKVSESEDGTYVDEWGVTYKTDAIEFVNHPLRGPIRTLEDAKRYSPPDPDAPHRLGKLPDMVDRYKGKRAIVFFHRAAFMWSAYLMGLDMLLESLLAEPELAELVMDKVLEANIAVARRAVRAGAEVVVLGDDFAHNTAPLMSPALFDEFILHRLTKMVRAIHDEGAFCVKHTDGNIYSILDPIVASGVDAINPIEPLAGMDLRTVKRLVGDKVCIVGNIDCGHLLSNGSPEEVEAAVIRAIQDAGAGGGYILGSSNSIHSSVKPENFVAMVRTARRYGAYGS